MRECEGEGCVGVSGGVCGGLHLDDEELDVAAAARVGERDRVALAQPGRSNAAGPVTLVRPGLAPMPRLLGGIGDAQPLLPSAEGGLTPSDAASRARGGLLWPRQEAAAL